MDPAGVRMEGFEVAAIDGRRGGERFEDADDAAEFAIDRGRVDARRVEQPPPGHGTVVGERAPHQNARQQRPGQHGAENQ